MNKKLLGLLGLFLVVGALLVFGQNAPPDCGSEQNNPCIISSESHTSIEANKWYQYRDQTFQAGDSTISSGDYYLQDQTGWLVPVVTTEMVRQELQALDSSGSVRSYVSISPRSPGEPSSSSTNLLSPDLITIDTPDGQQQLTRAAFEQYFTDCAEVACSIGTDSNSYSTPTESVTVREDATIRENTAENRVTVFTPSGVMDMTPDEFALLGLAGAENILVQGLEISYSSNEIETSIIESSKESPNLPIT